MITLEVIPHLELIDGNPLLVDAHWQELGLLGRDPSIKRNEDREIYLNAEKNGSAFTVGVRETIKKKSFLVGYIQVFLNVHPHNLDEVVANCINLFLYPEYRKEGIGKQMLQYTEKYAKKLGVTVFSICSNNEAPIEEFLINCGYRIYDKVYGKELNNDKKKTKTI